MFSRELQNHNYLFYSWNNHWIIWDRLGDGFVISGIHFFPVLIFFSAWTRKAMQRFWTIDDFVCTRKMSKSVLQLLCGTHETQTIFYFFCSLLIWFFFHLLNLTRTYNKLNRRRNQNKKKINFWIITFERFFVVCYLFSIRKYF